jgi:Mrp family chromosome partitioning ATPase
MASDHGSIDPDFSLMQQAAAKDQLSRQRIREMADIFRLTDEDLDEKRVIYSRMRDKRLLNVFRDIRTKLVEKANGENFTLMVTSVCEDGGATFTASNLAASIALDQGKTALIVDCNLYSPASEKFIEADQIGFSDFLENPSIAIEEIIYATGVPRLRLIPIGRSADIGPEYYTSYRMKQFIQELGGRYSDRYVVLDVPPITSTADARILSEYCDYVLLVVPYGKVTKDQLERSIANFSAEKVVGMVFNN